MPGSSSSTTISAVGPRSVVKNGKGENVAYALLGEAHGNHGSRTFAFTLPLTEGQDRYPNPWETKTDAATVRTAAATRRRAPPRRLGRITAPPPPPLPSAPVEQVRRTQDPLHLNLDDHPAWVGPRGAVALRVAQLGVADGVDLVLTVARPSSDSHRAPSTWLSTATPPRSALTAFCEPPVVMTRAICVLGSKVNPTATTCGELSARSVVSMAR